MSHKVKIRNFHLILILKLLSFVRADFRFCNNGPQRVLDTDCRGGLIFSRAIESKCGLLAKEINTAPVTVNLSQSVCEKNDGEIFTSSSEITFKQDIIFQEVLRSYDGKTIEEAVTISDPGSDECFKDCLLDWVDPQKAAEDEAAYDFGIPPPPPNLTEKQVNISEALFTYMSYTLDNVKLPVPVSDLHILDIFHMTLDVLEKHCHTPYLSSEFIESIYAAIRFLFLNYGEEVNDLGTKEWRIVKAGLEKCLRSPSKFIIKGTMCSDGDARITSINSVPHRLEAKSYRWGVFDPIIEAAWNALEFVHGYCYKEYIHDLNFQHILVRAVDALFRGDVRDRWMYPAKLKHDQYWNNMIGVQNINMTLRNIDACIQAGRKFSPYKDRLGRPFERQPGTYVAKVDEVAKEERRKHGGFRGSLDEYWAMYGTNGGVKSSIAGIGFCANDIVEYRSIRESLVGNCGEMSSSVSAKDKLEELERESENYEEGGEEEEEDYEDTNYV